MSTIRPARAGVLACATAFAVLFSSIQIHRLVSAKLINNFAFFVISLTMLGFAASGVALSRWRNALLARLDRLAGWTGAAFTLTMLLAVALFTRAPNVEDWGESSRSGFLLAFLACLPFALLFAVPFAFAGLLLGALLSSPDLRVRQLYALDLAGSAAGAMLAVPAIRWVGAELALLLGCLLLLVVGLVVGSARGAWLRAAAGLAVAGLVFGLAFPTRLMAYRYPRGSFLGDAQTGTGGSVLEYVAWDPLARIEVLRVAAPSASAMRYAALFDENQALLSRFSRVLTQNNNAYTYAPYYDGTPATLDGLDRSAYAPAYVASSAARPRALVLGVGGGLDVLTALRYDAREVTGVEVNGATLDILRRRYADYFHHWVRDPRVRLYHDEGRHFLTRSAGTWDVIQLSGVDSVSGTPAAAHVFSENDLYTVEAFRLFLSRLTADGIVNVWRQEWFPPRDMLRALAIAVEALRQSGAAHPAEHVVVLASRTGDFAAVLFKKTPFQPAEVRRVRDWIAASPYWYLAAAPGWASAPPNVYSYYLSLDDSRRERAFWAAYPFDVRPTTDDRPFFFRTSRWRQLLPSAREPAPVMEVGTLALAGVVGVAALLSVFVPLRQLAADGFRAAQAPRWAGFFVAIGLGYMAIEVALLQRFALLLGHPNYALSVVLAALLAATGLGSLASSRLLQAFAGELRFVSYAVAALALAFVLVVSPRLAAAVGLPFPLRVGIVFALIVPIGTLLGAFFPSGLEALKASSPAFAPWAWGLNGIASVLGPVVAVAFSMTWGIDGLLVAAVPIYLAAGFLWPGNAPGVG